MSRPMTSEPALTIGSIGAAVGAVIALAVSFGVSITDEQTAAILAVVAAAGPIVTAVVIRRQVYSPKGLARVMPEHKGTGPAPEDVEPGEHRRQD